MIRAPLSRRGFTWSKSIIEFEFLCHVAQGGFEGGQGVVCGASDQVLGAEHAGHAGAGLAQGLHAGGPGFHGGIFGVGEVKDSADDDAEHGDLVVEVAHHQQVQVVQFLRPEFAGIKAMFDGIGVAWLGAAGALCCWLSLFRLESLLLILGHDCCSLYEFIQPASEG